MSKEKIEKLKENFEIELKKLRKECSHEWRDDGYDVQGWRSVKCYKCSICGERK